MKKRISKIISVVALVALMGCLLSSALTVSAMRGEKICPDPTKGERATELYRYDEEDNLRAKATYAYDEQGNCIEEVEYRADEESGELVPAYKTVHEFNGEGLYTKRADYGWNAEKNDWALSSLDTYEWDENGNMTLSGTVSYDTATGEINYGYRDTVTYDGHCNETEILSEEYDTEAGEWKVVFHQKMEYKYDEDGCAVETTYFVAEGDEFKRTGRTERTYVDGRCTQSLNYEVDGETEKLMYKDEFTYDENGYLKEDYQADYDFAAGEWVPSRRNVYEHTADGDLTMENFFEYRDGEWVETGKYVYEFNDAHLPVKETESSLNQEDVLVTWNCQTYEYDEKGRETFYLDQRDQDGELVDFVKMESTYGDGTQTTKTYSMQEGEWVYDGRTEVIFESFLPMLLGDVNGDGEVNMKDVLALRRHIAHLETEFCEQNADVNGDSSVDMKDVLMLRQYIAHVIDAFGGGRGGD